MLIDRLDMGKKRAIALIATLGLGASTMPIVGEPITDLMKTTIGPVNVLFIFGVAALFTAYMVWKRAM